MPAFNLRRFKPWESPYTPGFNPEAEGGPEDYLDEQGPDPDAFLRPPAVLPTMRQRPPEALPPAPRPSNLPPLRMPGRQMEPEQLEPSVEISSPEEDAYRQHLSTAPEEPKIPFWRKLAAAAAWVSPVATPHPNEIMYGPRREKRRLHEEEGARLKTAAEIGRASCRERV